MTLAGRIRVALVLSIILCTIYAVDAVILKKPFGMDLRHAHMKQEYYLEAPVSKKNNIFLIESSCALMNFSKQSYTKMREPGGGLRLTARAACALEAAARAHPLRSVYYVHTCPVDAAALRRSAPLYARRVLALANVHLWVVPFADLARGTVVERLLRDGTLARSQWPVAHASDAMRLLLLNRFGGTYLDTDMLILKSLGNLKNFAGLSEIKVILNAVLDVASDPTGHKFGEEFLKELEDFHHEDYYTGATLLTRGMRRRCGTDEFENVTPEKCGGFHILRISTFYPVDSKNWKKYFEEQGASSVMKSLNDSLGVHVWNSLSSKYKFKISLPAEHPYAQIARRVCPSVVVSVGDKMI